MNFRTKKRGGGVCLYIQNQLQYKLRNCLQHGGNVPLYLLKYLNLARAHSLMLSVDVSIDIPLCL